MPAVARHIALLTLLAAGAFAADPDTVIGPTAPPVSDSWSAMSARSAGAATAAPRLRRAPRHWTPGPQPAPASSPTASAANLLLPRFASPLTAGLAFATLDYSDTGGWVPPDTMGSVGPNHYVVTLNSAMAIYSKTTGAQIGSTVSLDTFFTSLSPVRGESDPHVIFDVGSGRWFFSCIEMGDDGSLAHNPADNDALLAVSATNDPTGTWTLYRVPIAKPNSGGSVFLNDYDSLGTDANGVYLGVALFQDDTDIGARAVAIEKANLLAGSAFTPTIFNNLTDFYAVPQAARTTDAVAATGKAWLVDGSANAAAEVAMRSITWSGTAGSKTAAISSSIALATASCDIAPSAASLNGVDPIDTGDLRMLMATKRNGHLWTCRSVGVNASGTGSSADRAGCQWLDIDVSSGTPVIAQQGIVYDNAASTPRFYFYPAVIPNGQGHAAMAFSGCKSSEFVGAYGCGRLSSSTTGQMSAVTQLHAGEAKYATGDSVQRWGDYSHISVDPTDDMTFWTTQEYAKTTSGSFKWGTWTEQLIAPPPATPASCSPATVPTGATGVTVVLTATSSSGSGLFDPGAGFTRPIFTIGGTGVTVTSATVNSPTLATLTIDIASGAALTARTVTVTNPDGQTAASAAGILTIAAPPTADLALAGSPFAENGGTATVSANLSAPATIPTAVNVTFGGTATFGADYTVSSSTIIVPAGASTGSIILTGQDDLVADPGETVIVTQSTLNGATAGATTQVTATISDVTPVTASLSLSGSPFAENGGVATVTATLSRVSTEPVTVDLAFTGTATFGTDYVVSSSSIVVAAGATTGSITLTGQDDLIADPGETVIATVSGLTNADPGATQQVTATITDVAPVTADLSVADSPFNEHGGAATLTVTLSRVSTAAVMVTLGYGGTAAAARYHAPSSITVPAGDTSATGQITGVDDGMTENDETVVVSVTGLTNALAGATQQVTAVETGDDHPGGGKGCGIGGLGILLLAGFGLGWRRRQSPA